MARPTIRTDGVDWRHARVGAVIVAGLIVLAYAVFRVGEIFDVFADRYPLVTLVESGAGLTEGSPVTLAGQRVGQIERIDFVPVGRAGEHNLRIRLAVAQEVSEQIRSDSRVYIRGQGLLGDKYIDIEPGSPGARILTPEDTLLAGEQVDIETMLATAHGTMERLSVVIGNMELATGAVTRGEGTLGKLIYEDRLYVQLADAAAETEALVAELRSPDGTLGRLTRDPELYERLVAAAATVEAIGDTILHGGGTFARLLQDPTVYDRLLRAVARADTAAGGLAAFMDRLSAEDGSLQRLLSDPELYDQFLKAAVDLQNLIREIRANPQRFKPEVNIDIF